MTSPVPATERWPALADRRMLVVGASSGIGRALALLAARSGAAVAVAARRVEDLESLSLEATAAGGSAQRLWCDVTQPDAARSVAGDAARLLGGLDTLVLSAGIAPLGRLSDTSPEEWETVLATNLVGGALVLAGALEPLRASASGSKPRPSAVVLSTHIVERPWPGLVPYAASKAALATVARGLRGEEPWLRVFDVVVPNTMTPFADGWDKAAASAAVTAWANDGYLDGPVWSAEQTAAAVLDAVVDEDGPDDVDLTAASTG